MLARALCQKTGIRSQSTAPAVVLDNTMQEVMDSIHEAGTFKPERVITTRQAADIKVAGMSKNILNFCANNYLGLSVSRHGKMITVYQSCWNVKEYSQLLCKQLSRALCK